MVKFRDNIFIGGYQDVTDARQLKAAGITAVLNVAYEIDDPVVPPQMIRQIKIGMTDNNENQQYMKDLAVNTMEEMLHQKEVVLVHCAAGLSRSVYIAIMVVARLEKKDTNDVYLELQKIHPFALLGPLFHGENKYYRFYKQQEDASAAQKTQNS